jgi:hypothetical protein
VHLECLNQWRKVRHKPHPPPPVASRRHLIASP